MATDGTQALGAPKRSFGLLGSAFTLLVAAIALLALTRRKHIVHAVAYPATTPPVPAPSPASPTVAMNSRSVAVGEPPDEATTRHRRRLARFVTGTLFGVGAGVVLGIVAVVMLTIADPDVRSAVIVGAGFETPPTADGEVLARILAQDMNPTLLYADADVAALLARSDAVPDASEMTLPVVVQDEGITREDAAMLAALVALAVFGWGLVLWGSGGRLATGERSSERV